MLDSLSRRSFLGSTAGASLGVALAAGALARGVAAAPAEPPKPVPEGKQLKILVLGGTAFLGPAIVDHALARGHTVTLFNRGKTNPHLYPDLEKLRGDRGSPPSRRNPEGTPADLKALEGRKWDAVIDTSCYWPEQAEASAGLLKDAVKQYVLISTISVYPGFGTSNEEITEETPTGVKPRAEYKQWEYGAFKALAEQVCEDAMPKRVTNIRPGLIVGPGDPTDRFAWWPHRVNRGGEILAPGDAPGHFQVIDVRDLGAFCVHSIEQGVVGIYNATGFKGHLSLREFLHGCKCAIRTDCSFTWVTDEFLLAQKVRPWRDLPMWMPQAVLPWVNVEKGIAKGLTFRPVAETIRDTLDWELNERGKEPKPHLLPEREAEILAAWHAQHPAVSEDGDARTPDPAKPEKAPAGKADSDK